MTRVTQSQRCRLQLHAINRRGPHAIRRVKMTALQPKSAINMAHIALILDTSCKNRETGKSFMQLLLWSKLRGCLPPPQGLSVRLESKLRSAYGGAVDSTRVQHTRVSNSSARLATEKTTPRDCNAWLSNSFARLATDKQKDRNIRDVNGYYSRQDSLATPPTG